MLEENCKQIIRLWCSVYLLTFKIKTTRKITSRDSSTFLCPIGRKKMGKAKRNRRDVGMSQVEGEKSYRGRLIEEGYSNSQILGLIDDGLIEEGDLPDNFEKAGFTMNHGLRAANMFPKVRNCFNNEKFRGFIELEYKKTAPAVGDEITMQLAFPFKYTSQHTDASFFDLPETGTILEFERKEPKNTLRLKVNDVESRDKKATFWVIGTVLLYQ